jgi:hypothetical protein
MLVMGRDVWWHRRTYMACYRGAWHLSSGTGHVVVRRGFWGVLVGGRGRGTMQRHTGQRQDLGGMLVLTALQGLHGILAWLEGVVGQVMTWRPAVDALGLCGGDVRDAAEVWNSETCITCGDQHRKSGNRGRDTEGTKVNPTTYKRYTKKKRKKRKKGTRTTAVLACLSTADAFWGWRVDATGVEKGEGWGIRTHHGLNWLSLAFTCHSWPAGSACFFLLSQTFIVYLVSTGKNKIKSGLIHPVQDRATLESPSRLIHSLNHFVVQVITLAGTLSCAWLSSGSSESICL